jgi:hypothetical protein
MAASEAGPFCSFGQHERAADRSARRYHRPRARRKFQDCLGRGGLRIVRARIAGRMGNPDARRHHDPEAVSRSTRGLFQNPDAATFSFDRIDNAGNLDADVFEYGNDRTIAGKVLNVRHSDEHPGLPFALRARSDFGPRVRDLILFSIPD